MRLSFYTHERVHLAEVRELDAAELTAALTNHDVRAWKEGPAWSPAEIGPCKTPCRNTNRTSRKCEGGELHRHEANVLTHGVMVFDVDHISDIAAAALVERLQAASVAGAIHSTFSHNPPNDCGLRVVLYPARPIDRGEVKLVRDALIAALEIPADPATKDLSRLYYLPTAQPDRERFALALVGEPFDVDRALAVAPTADATTAPAQAPESVDIDSLRDALKRCKGSGKDLVGRVLAGEPLAPLGEHDVSLQRLAGVCATYLPDGTLFDTVAYMCSASLRAMGWEDGYDDCLRAFEDKYSRAVERTREYRAQQAAQVASVRAELAMGVAQCTLDPVAAEQTEDGKYTPAALEQWQVGENEWIIQKGEVFYVFVNGDYVPRLRVELPNCLHRDLCRAPISLVNDTGKELPAADITRRYGTVAKSVNADLSLQRSHYDALTGIFTEAVCPLRFLQPAHNEEIDRWLRLLGGDDAETLLDWIATVTRLDRQTCALYLYAKKGSGKNLFVAGLSRLWTTGTCTTLAEAFSNFNDAVAKCPLLFADEHLPDVRNITEEIRALTGTSTRSLKKKFRDTGSLIGAVRTVIAANNKDLFRPKNDMTEEDIDAVADRILFITVPTEAREYLKALGGADHLNDWIFGDKIAQHALWLRDNRVVKPSGDRFLVMGQKSAFHNRLAVNSGVAKQVCEVLVKQLVTGKPLPPTVADLFICGGGELYVNVKAIEAIWESHVRTNDRYPTDRIAKALAAISTGSVRSRAASSHGKPVRYARVRVEQLLAWAEENGVADKEELTSILAKTDGRAVALHAGHLDAIAANQ